MTLLLILLILLLHFFIIYGSFLVHPILGGIVVIIYLISWLND